MTDSVYGEGMEKRESVHTVGRKLNDCSLELKPACQRPHSSEKLSSDVDHTSISVLLSLIVTQCQGF